MSSDGFEVEEIKRRRGVPLRPPVEVCERPICNVNLMLCNSFILLRILSWLKGLQRHTDRFLRLACVNQPSARCRYR